MNSLGSWIDQAELDRLVAAVVPKMDPEASPDPDPPSSQKRAHGGSPFPWNRPADTSRHQQQAVPQESEPPPAPERFPVAEEVEKFRDKVAAIKDKARALGVLSPGHPDPVENENYSQPPRTARLKTAPLPSGSAPSPRKSHPPFRPPEGPLRLRLECFGEWAATIARAEAVIVADSQGDLVFERGADPAWVSSVSVVASAGERAGRHLAISGNTLIHIDLTADQKLAVLPCQTKFGNLSVGLVVSTPLQPALANSITDAVAAAIERR